MKIKLERANISDARVIWEMQKLAFSGLLKKYEDYDTSPASEALEKTEARLKQPYSYFYFIQLDGKNIGAIRVVDKKSGEAKRISPLFILPDFRNNGYAQSAILQVEQLHGSFGWELDTILQEECNCHLYEKAGYHRTDVTNKINDKMTLIIYKK